MSVKKITNVIQKNKIVAKSSICKKTKQNLSRVNNMISRANDIKDKSHGIKSVKNK